MTDFNGNLYWMIDGILLFYNDFFEEKDQSSKNENGKNFFVWFSIFDNFAFHDKLFL